MTTSPPALTWRSPPAIRRRRWALPPADWIAAASALIRQSVTLAQRARDDYRAASGSEAPLLVAGSVGPYGAYLANGAEYRGDYALPAAEMKDFHRPRGGAAGGGRGFAGV